MRPLFRLIGTVIREIGIFATSVVLRTIWTTAAVIMVILQAIAMALNVGESFVDYISMFTMRGGYEVAWLHCMDSVSCLILQRLAVLLLKHVCVVC